MTKAKVHTAVSEAKRFLNLAKCVLEKPDVAGEYLFGSKETAALKRASMDLTRALADMRGRG